MKLTLVQPGLKRATDFLLANQGKDSGWGYIPGQQSYPEPLSYALLALQKIGTLEEKKQRENLALGWLTARTNTVGALSLETKVTAPVDLGCLDNWGTIVAFYALRKLNLGAELSARYLQYLLNSRGNQIDKKGAADLKLNGDLLAWSWARGTASWVEPTAYALLALKANDLKQHERVKIGEVYLLDRACYEGGWNYGNKEVLGVILEPMPTNTCFALLALQDIDRNHETIKKSVAWLEQEIAARQSSMLLALGSLCLDIYGRPVDKWLENLLVRQEENGSWRSNIHLTALAALALQTQTEQKNIFKL